MRHVLALLLAVIAAVGLGAAAAQPPRAAEVVSPELLARPWLNEIVRHLYRWHIEESDVGAVMKAGEIIFWVRETRPELDAGDQSRFAEVVMPQFSLLVKVKRADYTIPEFNLTVKSDVYRITHVQRIDGAAAKRPGDVEVRAAYTEVRDELFRTRNQAGFPEGELLDRLRTAVRTEIRKDTERSKRPMPEGTQIAFLAPLSPIANETWVFWETGRTLIRFASDIELANPAVWEHEKLTVRLYQVDERVVVSLDEVGGSNAFMTRDEAGRALYNCIVLGRRLELHPPAQAAPVPGNR